MRQLAPGWETSASGRRGAFKRACRAHVSGGANKTSSNNRASRAKITLLAAFANKARPKIASNCCALVGVACWHLFKARKENNP